MIHLAKCEHGRQKLIRSALPHSLFSWGMINYHFYENIIRGPDILAKIISSFYKALRNMIHYCYYWNWYWWSKVLAVEIIMVKQWRLLKQVRLMEKVSVYCNFPYYRGKQQKASVYCWAEMRQTGAMKLFISFHTSMIL